MRLTGEIGKLELNGKEVGGFRGWTVFVHFEPPIHSWVMLTGYWLFKRIYGPVKALFYSEDDHGNLRLVREYEVTIELPDEYPLDEMILDPVKLSFDKEFDWREQKDTASSLPVA